MENQPASRTMGNELLQYDLVRELGDMLDDGLLVFSLPEKTVKYVNNFASDLLGVGQNASQNELESVMNLIIPEDRQYVKSRFTDLATKSVVPDVQFRIRKGGGELFICCNAYLLLNRSTVVLYIQDISKPKQHESYLVEFGARKNTLLDMLSHYMSGALNLMQHLTKEAEKLAEGTNDKSLTAYLGLVHENARHCVETIGDLLRDEHGESPHIFAKPSRINIVERIHVVYEELQQGYVNRKFFLEVPKEPIYIITDPVKLLQIINNLTSNAIKFSKPSDAITIKIEGLEHEVIVSVQDNGIGIPSELQPYVFDRYGQARRTGLDGQKSMGLGLSICKNLVGLLGGEIWFESEEGKGSVFHVSLPGPEPHANN